MMKKYENNSISIPHKEMVKLKNSGKLDGWNHEVDEETAKKFKKKEKK